jgi:hypothetical protein
MSTITLPSSNSVLKREKKLSACALSEQFPDRSLIGENCPSFTIPEIRSMHIDRRGLNGGGLFPKPKSLILESFPILNSG